MQANKLEYVGQLADVSPREIYTPTQDEDCTSLLLHDAFASVRDIRPRYT